MKRTHAEDIAKFNESVAILVEAYLNDTLKHADCCACAVGNLMNAHRPFSRKERRGLSEHESGWVKVFCTFTPAIGDRPKYQAIDELQYHGLAKEQIDSTGYAWQELAKIENAFELVDSKTDRMFNGLMAVVTVLASIHSIDLETTEAARKLFVKI